MATLLVVEGPSEGLKFALGEHNLVMIGRDHSATLQILDGRISRFHVQIKRMADTGGHAALDFESANGVYLNSARITAETPLKDGDLIQIGDSSILYAEEDEPDAQRVSQLLRQYGQARYQTQLDTQHQKPG
jgi:pSer/pThr/pTyr-binding forkhead associated (FHA) protein